MPPPTVVKVGNSDGSALVIKGQPSWLLV